MPVDVFYDFAVISTDLSGKPGAKNGIYNSSIFTVRKIPHKFHTIIFADFLLKCSLLRQMLRIADKPDIRRKSLQLQDPCHGKTIPAVIPASGSYQDAGKIKAFFFHKFHTGKGCPLHQNQRWNTIVLDHRAICPAHFFCRHQIFHEKPPF